MTKATFRSCSGAQSRSDDGDLLVVVAGRVVIGAATDVVQVGDHVDARCLLFGGQRRELLAAGAELAAGGRVGRAWQVAGKDDPRSGALLLRIGDRDRRE